MMVALRTSLLFCSLVAAMAGFTQNVSVTGSVTDVSCNGGNNGSIQYQITGGPGPIHYSWNTGDSGIASGSCTYIVALNNPGVALSQFQIRVDVPLMPGMNANFSNLFFTDSAGNHIPFWLKEFPSSSSATFWVRVPYIPSGPSAIFLSYCLFSSVSESDPYTTFEFFENFDSGTLTNWSGACENINIGGESCNMTNSNTIFFSPGYSLYLTSNGSCFVSPYDGATSTASRTVTMINDSLVFDYNSRVSVELYGFCSGGTGSSNRVFADNVFLGIGQSVNQGGACAVNTTGWADATSLPFEETNGSTLITLKTVGGDCDNAQGWFDNVRIRKFRSNPPVVTLDTTPQLILNNLAAGTYTITMTDYSGNTTTASFTVNEPAPMTVNADSSNVTCFSAADGAAWVIVSGGNSPYTYNWNTTSTADSITGLSAGIFSVTVTDNNGCSATDSTTVIEPSAALTADADSMNLQCAGVDNGKAWVTAAGGTNPYSFYWNTGDAADTITGLTAGTFSVTVTDNNGCSTLASTTVQAAPAALLLDIGSTDVTCFGMTDGKAWVTASGGNPAYVYSWDNSQSSDTITGLSGGTYTVTVTDANGCMADTFAQVATAPPALLVNTDSADVSCFGEATGQAWTTVSGGVPPYMYSWNNGASSDSLTGLTAGTYTVTVSDAHLCTVNASVTIHEPNAALSTLAGSIPAVCFGENSGSAFTTASGGTSPYTYLWNTGSSNDSLPNLAAGVYNVTVTDANNCTTVATATITEPAAISITLLASSPACFQQDNGTLVVSASNGIAPLTYTWSNGALTDSIGGLMAGDYMVTVTDIHQCSATANEEVIDDNFSISLQAEPTTQIIEGNTVTLSATAIGSDSIWWQPLNVSGVSVVTVSPPTTTTYVVQAYSTQGCYASDSVKITVSPKATWLFPTGFSPNGDGRNDFFRAILHGPVQLVSLTVYNRWGEKVYEQHLDDYNGWDGTYKGEEQPMGTYVYYAVLQDSSTGSKETVHYSGNITLVR